MVTVLDRENTILNRFIAQMRDVTVQGDSMRFRRNLERAGEIMAYEISKTLEYQPRSVETPLGEAEIMMPDEEIVVATILRAGLPFHQGFLNYFDNAQNAFVSAYRKYSKDNSFNIKVEYISTCELDRQNADYRRPDAGYRFVARNDLQRAGRKSRDAQVHARSHRHRQ